MSIRDGSSACFEHRQFVAVLAPTLACLAPSATQRTVYFFNKNVRG